MKSVFDLKNLDITLDVFFHTHGIHKAVINVETSIFLAFSTELISFCTDFSLNQSRDNKISFLSFILKISIRFLIIHKLRNKSI
ncbi:MAG: hypothetical protein P1U46_04505 [Patescibacteria group bacterium]|nr:hypothetical protein [Patescibacteria group bacterium]